METLGATTNNWLGRSQFSGTGGADPFSSTGRWTTSASTDVRCRKQRSRPSTLFAERGARCVPLAGA
jgi:hypothetical protein